jgi:hypothetical protein
MRRLALPAAAAGFALTNRRLANVALAAIMPVGFVVGISMFGGTASASTPDVSCTGVTGSMNFNPALGSGNKKEKVTFTNMALQGCVDTGSGPFTIKTVKITLKEPGLTDKCSSFNLDTAVVTVKASTGGGFAPTKIAFPSGEVQWEPAASGVILHNGTATGSYSGPSQYWEMDFDSESESQLRSCTSSVSSAMIVSGSATL